MLTILDISEYQNPDNINYDKVAKEIDGVILRIGYTGWSKGTDQFLDTHFMTHYAEFKKRATPIGIYFFGVGMTEEIATKEANWVLSTLKKHNIVLDLPIWYDTEPSGNEAGKIGHQFMNRESLTRIVQTFCTTIEEAGYYTGIYASEYWYKNMLIPSKLRQFDTWIANWVTEPDMNYGMWQFTSKGYVDGYNYNVDKSITYKDYKQIIKEKGLNKLESKPDTKTPYLIFKITDKPEDYPGFNHVRIDNI